MQVQLITLEGTSRPTGLTTGWNSSRTACFRWSERTSIWMDGRPTWSKNWLEGCIEPAPSNSWKEEPRGDWCWI